MAWAFPYATHFYLDKALPVDLRRVDRKRDGNCFFLVSKLNLTCYSTKISVYGRCSTGGRKLDSLSSQFGANDSLLYMPSKGNLMLGSIGWFQNHRLLEKQKISFGRVDFSMSRSK